MKVKFKRINELAVVPAYARPGDAGADLYSVEDVWIHGGQHKLIKIGICIEIPEGYVGLLHPRSGLAARHGITMLNAPGTIDAGYRGELMVNLINHSDASYQVHPGDRIAQLLIQKVEAPNFKEVSELSDSERGEGGHGSTG